MEDISGTSQPSVPATVSAVPPSQPPVKSKLPKILLIAVALIGGIGLAWYIVNLNNQGVTIDPDTGKVETPLSVSESVCGQELAKYPINDWKIYDNTIFGIHLKYPDRGFTLSAPIEKYTSVKDAMLAVKNDVLLESLSDCSIDIYLSSLKDLETQDSKTYISSKELAYGRFNNVIPSDYTVSELSIDGGGKATMITGGDLGSSLLKRVYYINTTKNLAVEITYYLRDDDLNSDTADKILTNTTFDAQK
ncbi:MAG: hypothetical protein Q7K33_02920 [Candidatus Berkelbacteria bacterium]|nr:hypothetical protein [Candidatus Berkelbacteria bacterium]